MDFSLNPDLRTLTPLQCLDRLVQYAGSIGLRVILARSSARAGQSYSEALWWALSTDDLLNYFIYNTLGIYLGTITIHQRGL